MLLPRASAARPESNAHHLQSASCNDYQQPWVTTRPLAGMRGHDLGTGGLLKTLRVVSEGSVTELLTCITALPGVSPEALAQIVSDYELALPNLTLFCASRQRIGSNFLR